MAAAKSPKNEAIEPTPVPDEIVDWFVAFLRGMSKDESR